MSQELWTAVDSYFNELLLPPDPALESALAASADGGLPDIQVAPNQGKLLWLLAKLIGAKHVLEVGTLGGYSTIWLGKGMLPKGRLITLEIDPKHMEIAAENIANAQLPVLAEVRGGSALDLLPALHAEGGEPFDLVFIDADKVNTPTYFEWALKLTHVGSLIIVDNVVRKGAVIETDTTDPNVQGIRRFLEMAANEPRVTGTAFQTVGSKGYDGLSIFLVTG